MIPIISPPPQFEQLRMEPPRMEQPWFEQPRMELPRFEQPRMVPPCFEQPRMEPPRFEPRMEPLWMGPPQFRFHRAKRTLCAPTKIGEIGQEMIIMVETFLRKVYLTEG